jgi:ATP phosphoribosyltransferase regulatory subunit
LIVPAGSAKVSPFVENPYCLSMTKTHPALLPNGLSDLLHPEADLEAQAIHTLMNEFAAFGYQRVKPPLVEFEDSLLAPGPGQAMSRNTFRLMDPVSQRMMGLRADTTAQIARIAATRLSGESRPLRLSYAADVMRVNGGQLRPERQFCQVGCEMVGASMPRDDAETALLALKALNKAGLSNLSIDLTVPTLIQHVFDQEKTSDDDRRVILDLAGQRDRDALDGMKDKAAKTLAALAGCSGKADEALVKLKALKLKGGAGNDVAALEKVYSLLKEGMEIYGLGDAQVTIDPLEQRGFEYQTGVSFTLFAKGVRGELGRGGRYCLGENGYAETASGFTLYMDTVLRALPKGDVPKQKKVSTDTDWKTIRDLQQDGWIVVRG